MEPLTRDQWVRVIVAAEANPGWASGVILRLAYEGLRLHDMLERAGVSA